MYEDHGYTHGNLKRNFEDLTSAGLISSSLLRCEFSWIPGRATPDCNPGLRGTPKLFSARK